MILEPRLLNIWTRTRLELFLYRHSIQWKYWGPTFGAKSLDDLLEAIRCGEIILESRGKTLPPLLNKYIVVVSVWCKRGGKWLLLREYRESRSTKTSSDRPYGNCSFSEKVRTRNETCLDAASRGIKRKLRFLDTHGFTLREGRSETGTITASVSYPDMVEVDHMRHYHVVLTEKGGRYQGHYEFRETEYAPLTSFRWIEQSEAIPSHEDVPPLTIVETCNE